METLFYFIFIKFLTKSSKMYKRKFYAVRTLHVHFNISSKKCISWDTIYDTHQLMHVLAPWCHFQGVIITNVYKPK